jgi:hypothetical protein
VEFETCHSLFFRTIEDIAIMSGEVLFRIVADAVRSSL